MMYSKITPYTRYIYGRFLPYATATALSSLVMYSRIKDQRHWLSDVLTGALSVWLCIIKLSYAF